MDTNPFTGWDLGKALDVITMLKKAFVTGASRGIGRGIALKLAQNGYDVAFTYHSQKDDAKSVKKQIEAMNQKCYYYQASMEKPEVPEEVTQKAIADLGGIDLLVCNAGLTRHNNLLDVERELIDFVYGLNYRSYILCAKIAFRNMVENKIKGSVIYISSTRGIRAYKIDSIYGSLKAALHRIVQSFAIEMAEHGIRINSIAPGATAIRDDYSLEELQSGYVSSLIPLKRRGKPDDIANLVNYLASKEAEYITGETIRVDGGLILYGPNENEKGGMF